MLYKKINAWGFGINDNKLSPNNSNTGGSNCPASMSSFQAWARMEEEVLFSLDNWRPIDDDMPMLELETPIMVGSPLVDPCMLSTDMEFIGTTTPVTPVAN